MSTNLKKLMKLSSYRKGHLISNNLNISIHLNCKNTSKFQPIDDVQLWTTRRRRQVEVSLISRNKFNNKTKRSILER